MVVMLLEHVQSSDNSIPFARAGQGVAPALRSPQGIQPGHGQEHRQLKGVLLPLLVLLPTRIRLAAPSPLHRHSVL